MIETLSVSLSGPAFSFLLYENLKGKYSQEGFLLGELVEKETSTITDNDQAQVHISRTVRISCSMPCPLPHYFYDAAGRIDSEKIKDFLGDMTPRVVAWYKYKANSSFNLTFREKIIHRQLAQFFNIPSEFFSCCLLTSESSKNGSTHSFSQTFMRYNNQKFEQIPMHIVNLSDPPYVYKTPEPVSDTFSNIVNKLAIDPSTAGGPNPVMRLQHALQKHTDHLVEELSEAEAKLFQLEQEVKLLKEGAKEKDLNSASHNDQLMDTDLERTPTKARGRGKTNITPKRKTNQSPVKKTSPSGREIVTRSMKKL